MDCGVSMKELHDALTFHLHTPHITSLIPRSSPPPTVVSKTRGAGKEDRVSNVCQCSWSNVTWIDAHLRFIVHTLHH